MHDRILDAARFGTAAQSDDGPDGLSCARGIVFALIIAVPMWCLIGMLAAIALRWL